MLTGMRPFAGDGVAEVLASVLAREPDWTRLPSTLPPALGTYIRRCLHKNPKQRIADVQDVRLALDGAFDTGGPPPLISAPVTTWRRVATLAATAMIGGSVVAAVVWVFMRPFDCVPPRVSAAITPPDAAALTISGHESGTKVRFRDHATWLSCDLCWRPWPQLFVRALDALESLSVFTGQARTPFLFPDGQWIHFVSAAHRRSPGNRWDGRDRGATRCPIPRGPSWGPDGTIIFATTNPETGLQRVPAKGGATSVAHPTASGEAIIVAGSAPGLSGRPVTLHDGRRSRCGASGGVGCGDWDADGGPARWQSRPLHAERSSGLRDGRHASAVAFDPIRLEMRGSVGGHRNVVTTNRRRGRRGRGRRYARVRGRRRCDVSGHALCRIGRDATPFAAPARVRCASAAVTRWQGLAVFIADQTGRLALGPGRPDAHPCHVQPRH